MSASRTRAVARGVVFIHSTPVSLCPHIGWALESVLGQPVHLEWTKQPVAPGCVRTELSWAAEPGTGARLTTALRGWEGVRYEVTEEPTPGCDGSRWASTPDLGIHHTWTNASGDAVINEDRLRSVLIASGGDPEQFRVEVAELLGTAWDQELEPFRYAGDGATVRWLHRVS